MYIFHHPVFLDCATGGGYMNRLQAYVREQRRFARKARWHYIRALNYSGDVAKYHHEQAEHLNFKALAALALVQLEVSSPSQ